MFGIETDKNTGDWKKLRNEKLLYLYCFPDVLVIRSRSLRRNICVEFFSKPEGKRSF
jgi:hypothetical protein